MTDDTLTTQDILDGAAYAVAHPEEYDQSRWCGTACCVLGHARRLRGYPELDRGLRDDEYLDPSPRAQMLRAMLTWMHEDTAALMPFVRDDGTIVVPPGGVGAFGAGAWIGVGATVGAGARIGERAWIGERATVGAGAWIGVGATVERGARIGERAWIGERATVGVGATVGAGARIGERATVRG